MNFLSTEIGDINVAHIVRIQEVKNASDKWMTKIYYTFGGEIKTTYADQTFDGEELSAPVISAQPGFSVVQLLGDPPFDSFLMPVVGWKILVRTAAPICVEDIYGEYGIVSPNGTVIVPGGGIFDSVVSFRAEQIKEKEERESRLSSIKKEKP